MTHRTPQDPRQSSSPQPSHRQPFYRDYGVADPLVEPEVGALEDSDPRQVYQPPFSDRDPQISRPQPSFERPSERTTSERTRRDYNRTERQKPERKWRDYDWREQLKQRTTAATKSVFGLGSQLAETVQEDPELSQVGLVGVTLLILGILLLWQWRLGVAVLVGSAALFLIYSWALPGGGLRWQRWQEQTRTLNQPLVLAAVGGSVATLGTYVVVSIWAEAEQRWLATGAIVQGILSLGILSLLGWEWIQRRQERGQSLFERHLSEVASPDPFRRLIGIRHLQGMFEQDQASPNHLRLGLDFLRLALERERDPVVKEAILEALSVQGIPMVEPRQLAASIPPVATDVATDNHRDPLG